MADGTPSAEEWIAIYSLIIRYARGLDTRDYEMLKSCFMEDAVARYVTPGMASDITFTGPHELADGLRKIHSTLDATLHRVTNHAIMVDGERGHGRTYVDVLEVAGGDSPSTLQQIGYYDDEFARVDGEWKFASRTYYGVHTAGNKNLVKLPS